MKKAFFVMSLLFAGFNGFASDVSEKPLDASKSKTPSVIIIVRPVFIECCSTASMPWNGATVSCTVCAATCDGPQGSQALAADCLMDVMAPGN